ncbi:MAG: DUF983 domain-containing protein [Sediminibacterium sp.]|nr:DUF983 domain-containing protein [Sediminibacterium sp.]
MIFKGKCPVCKKGNMYISQNPYNLKKIVTMHDNCPVCGQKSNLEIGFYYGTGYVSYALSVAYLCSFSVSWRILIGFDFVENPTRLYLFLICGILSLILIQPLFMRWSRIIWLSWFVNKKNS